MRGPVSTPIPATHRRLYRPDEVAKLLGVSVNTVYRRIQDGWIPSVRVSPRLLRIPAEELHRRFPELPR